MKRPPRMRSTRSYDDSILARKNTTARSFKNLYQDPADQISNRLSTSVTITVTRSFTCGEPHDRRNPNWKPFRLLWDYCERTGYDFYVVRDIIFERLGRKLVCECEVLRDDKKHRRMELEGMFGVDFGRPGKRGVELV